MKYKISDLRTGDFEELNITEFFPSATEPVVIKIRRLTEKKRSDVVALQMLGQSIKGGNIEIQDTAWYQKANEIRLLNCVIFDESFPFEKWDNQFVNEIGEKCPEMILKILNKIEEVNRPLAERNETISET
jgi:hypothetical protein